MKMKVSLRNKRTGEKLLERTLMSFEGSSENLLELMSALRGVKSECNSIANENGMALKECETLISLV